MSDNLDKAKNNRSKWIRIVLSIIKLSILFLIVFGVPAYLLIYRQNVITEFKSIDDVVKLLQHYKSESIIYYIFIQALQIIISVIPGQAFQFAAGYLYGFIFGVFLSIIGAVIGTLISFYIARMLGKDAVHTFVKSDKINYFIEKLNTKKAYTIVFILYLIPGLPKDIVSYAAGISEMKFKPFILLATVGRLPGMCGSLLFGAFYMKENYIAMVITGVMAVMIFLICFIKRKKIIHWLDEVYEKVK